MTSILDFCSGLLLYREISTLKPLLYSRERETSTPDFHSKFPNSGRQLTVEIFRNVTDSASVTFRTLTRDTFASFCCKILHNIFDFKFQPTQHNTNFIEM